MTPLVEDCPPYRPWSFTKAILCALGTILGLYFLIPAIAEDLGLRVALFGLKWLLAAIMFGWCWAMAFGGKR